MGLLVDDRLACGGGGGGMCTLRSQAWGEWCGYAWALRQWNLTPMDCTSWNDSIAVPMREDVTCEDRSVCMSLAATPYLTVYAAAKNSLMSSD